MDRLKTAIKGFDELIEGGFVRNTVNLIAGPAGSGKSLFGMQFIYNGVRLFDETGIYITLEEGSENVNATMKTHNMDIEQYITEGKLYIIDLGEVEKDTAKTARRIRGFESMAEFLANLIKISHAKRVVVDNLSAIGINYETSGDLRQGLFRFGRFLKENNVTALLITESLSDDKITRFGVEEFISDSYIQLMLREEDGQLNRYMMVRKIRFSAHDTKLHPYQIVNEGIRIEKKK
ncbi:RAD55 family ATPase [[Eubacterium] cellulosolvens]